MFILPYYSLPWTYSSFYLKVSFTLHMVFNVYGVQCLWCLTYHHCTARLQKHLRDTKCFDMMQANVFPLPPAEFVVIPLPAELRHHRYVPAMKLEGRRLPTLQERIDSNCLNSYCLLLPPTILETHACGGIEHPRRGQG